jgi:hypothetical protein
LPREEESATWSYKCCCCCLRRAPAAVESVPFSSLIIKVGSFFSIFIF